MSGPEETPNGGDRLAQIEELRRTGQLGAITVSDVIALVEIAKAARAVNEHAKRDLPEWYADDGDYTVEDFDYFIQLDRALARLDSGAAEGDA